MVPTATCTTVHDGSLGTISYVFCDTLAAAGSCEQAGIVVTEAAWLASFAFNQFGEESGHPNARES